jgi:transposase
MASPMPVAENNTAPLPIDDETRSCEKLIAKNKHLRLEVNRTGFRGGSNS